MFIAALLALATLPVTPTPVWPDLPPTTAWGLTVADWNGDGTSDVLVINHRDGHQEPRPDWHDWLLVSDGDTWRMELELPYADRHGCTALDADADGRLDFFCAVGSSQTNPNGDGLGPNELWLQTADSWIEAAAAWGIDDPPSRGRFTATVDWNRDGLDDLFVGIAPDHPASIWLNRGNHFEPVPTPDHWGTSCAVPWRGGVVICDVGPAIGQTAWWLHPDHEPVNLGPYFKAIVSGDHLALFGETLSVDGVDIALPRRGWGSASAINGDNLYLPATACILEHPVDEPDMIVTAGTVTDVTDDSAAPTCTGPVAYLDDGRILIFERTIDGTPLGAHIR